ncbi:GSK-3-binding protein FRAT2 [Monodelphis domestica]|uniref:GSK-3-binding protein FRAT2 n=1 Tax=Monodelphis domestica TaxID=13616 RepID=UPI0024E26DDF|nr:GSK-3-binding protein FRAT2 [Monodelphis domestica]
MPCRREEEDDDDEAAAAGEEGEEDDEEGEGEEEESFLVLQQSVTVGGSGDVDRLVAQIGEALQLDAAAHGSRPAPRGPLARKQPPPPPPPPPLLRPPVLQQLLLPPPPPGPAPAPLQPAGPLQCAGSWASDVGAASHPSPQPLRVSSGPCAPGRAPGRSSAPTPHACKRGFPQPLPGPCRRAWLRGAAASRRLQQQQHQHHQYRYRGQPGLRAGEDDPHQLLQQLVLSGNLIKEAVRRLRRAVAVVAGAVAPTTPGAGPSFVFAPEGGTDWDGRDSISLQPSTTSLL